MTDNPGATFVPVDLLRKYDRPGPRYTSYPTVPVWAEDINVDNYKKALQNVSVTKKDLLSLYCHIPFCRKRCYYCGCNTCVTSNMDNVEKYISTLVEEIKNTAELLDDRNKVNQLHFGGGTPTFLDIKGLGRILDELERRFEFIKDCEKSIELDPRVTTLGQLDFLAARGFNRASLGVQDFDNKVQKAIGREQPEHLVREVTEHCRKLGFQGINFDLIYGLPLQDVNGFTQTLDKAIALKPDRLAIYSFAYLPDIKSHQSRIVPGDLPSTEMKYRLFARAIEKLTAEGYRQIGMDHFALPDDELSLALDDGRLSRNFMGYTVQAAPEMIGFGMSAIGYINNTFFQNYSKIDSYKNAINENGFAIYRGKKSNRSDLIRKYVITSLMCNFRLGFNQLMDEFDINYHDYFAEEHKNLKAFFEDGFINVSSEGLEITELGRTFVRNIAMTFDSYLNHDSEKDRPAFSRTI
jgi:oxygen-independent coproporphyrinogen-3 oxidase